jgi:hypothetical protein
VVLARARACVLYLGSIMVLICGLMYKMGSSIEREFSRI